MRSLCIGDIHGDVVALHQCLERAKVKRDDHLIILGDIGDGFRRTKGVIDTLLQFDNIDIIAGNHDRSTEGTCNLEYGWILGWMLTGEELPLWKMQGGQCTISSYGGDHENVPLSHINLLLGGSPYMITNRKDVKSVFVHGGFDPLVPIADQDPEFLMWDRKLCVLAQYNKIKEFDQVFVGHTCVRAHGSTDFKPIFYNNLVMMDTGSGWYGKLTIMDIDTLEYWQSDLRNIHDDDEPEIEYTWLS